MSGFLGVPVGAAYHLVFALTHLLTPLAGGLAAVAAIVLFTAAVRLLISPLSLRALRGQAAMARLAPEVQALRARHARQPERLQRELTALYQREGTSPWASFLPLLAQWPFLSVMYLLFRSGTIDGTANQLLSDGLFGVPLGTHWLSGVSLFSVHGAIFLAVFAALAAVCYLSARLAQRPAPAAPAAAVPADPAGFAGLNGAGSAAPNAHADNAARHGTTVPAGPAGPARTKAAPAIKKAKASPATSVKPRPSATKLPKPGSAATSVKPRPSATSVKPRPAATSVKRRPAVAPPGRTGPDPAELVAGGKAVSVLTKSLPYLTVVIAAFAPLAAAIYLLTTTAWTLAERRLFLHRTARPASVPVPEPS